MAYRNFRFPQHDWNKNIDKYAISWRFYLNFMRFHVSKFSEFPASKSGQSCVPCGSRGAFGVRAKSRGMAPFENARPGVAHPFRAPAEGV